MSNKGFVWPLRTQESLFYMMNSSLTVIYSCGIIHVFWWTIYLFEEGIWVLIKTQSSAQKRKSSFFKVMAMGHAMHELNLQTLVSNWLTSTLKMPWHVPLHVLHLIKPAHTPPKIC